MSLFNLTTAEIPVLVEIIADFPGLAAVRVRSENAVTIDVTGLDTLAEIEARLGIHRAGVALARRMYRPRKIDTLRLPCPLCAEPCIQTFHISDDVWACRRCARPTADEQTRAWERFRDA